MDPEKDAPKGLSPQDISECTALLDWGALCLNQGISDEDAVRILNEYLLSKGLMADFLAHARIKIKIEKLTSPGEPFV